MSRRGNDDDSECTIPIPPPADVLARYSVDSDPHAERDIADYVEGQARDETVQYVERVKREAVLGQVYDIWDVTTDKGRWWVITNLTNLYSHQHFPSLDYALSLHIGLMARLRQRDGRVDADDPSPFDEVFRRVDQAEQRLDHAVEAEDYQTVGMHLREALISLVSALRRRTTIPEGSERPQDANFLGWSEILLNTLCGGASNKDLRQHLKSLAKETWQLVNWLTHHRNATATATSIALHSTQTLVGHLIQILERSKTDQIERCPVCSSRNLRSHYDINIPPDGAYFSSCGACGWDDHPMSKEDTGQADA